MTQLWSPNGDRPGKQNEKTRSRKIYIYISKGAEDGFWVKKTLELCNDEGFLPWTHETPTHWHCRGQSESVKSCTYS